MRKPSFKFGMIASLLGVAVLVMGATFALWGDRVIYGNDAGNEFLTLEVNSSSTIGFEQTAMAPGINREFDFVVASRDGQVVPDADLTLALTNLVGKEDGCRGNLEIVDDPDCNDTASGGEFITDAVIIVNASQPTTDLANACNSTLHPRGSRVSATSLADFFAAGPVSLLDPGVTLGPGEGICVGMGLNLPVSADNGNQGDSATWDFQYDLTQVAP